MIQTIIVGLILALSVVWVIYSFLRLFRKTERTSFCGTCQNCGHKKQRNINTHGRNFKKHLKPEFENKNRK